MTKPRDIVERIRTRITHDPVTDCWNWTGGVAGQGYGTVYDHTRQGKVYVHRAMYERFIGPIPPGLTIDHLCKNKRCANPAHMEVVTRGENARRGSGADWQRRKTTCPRGHAYDAVRKGHGILSRFCRRCYRAQMREFYQRRKDAKR